MWVSANFSQLGDLQQSVARTGAGIDGEHQDWTAQVRALVEAWPDAAGMDFDAVNAAAVTFARVNNEFLLLLGGAVGTSADIYSGALATARAAVGG
jgi:hypothetical protein